MRVPLRQAIKRAPREALGRYQLSILAICQRTFTTLRVVCAWIVVPRWPLSSLGHADSCRFSALSVPRCRGHPPAVDGGWLLRFIAG